MKDPDRTDKAKATGDAAPDQEDDDEEGGLGSSADAAGNNAGGGAGNPAAAEDPVEKYRTLLSTLERDSQRSYDKAILTLSGGALGVTISFLKNVIHATAPAFMGVLFASWACWGLSLASVLYSFYASNIALRKAQRQLEDGTIGEEGPGGAYDCATAILNAASGLFFLAGTFLFVYFAYANMGVGHG
jgi:hypothetical protein